MPFKAPTETTKVKREPKVKKEPAEPKVKKEPGQPKVKKEPVEPKAPRIKKEKADDSNESGGPQSLAQRITNKRKSGGSAKKPKKNPWETDSEDEEEISDFSGVSDDNGSDSDGDFRHVSKKVKANGNSNHGAAAVIKDEADSSVGKFFSNFYRFIPGKFGHDLPICIR